MAETNYLEKAKAANGYTEKVGLSDNSHKMAWAQYTQACALIAIAEKLDSIEDHLRVLADIEALKNAY